VLQFRQPAVENGLRDHTWPDFEAKGPSTVFSPRPPLRKLVVVIDDELLATQPQSNRGSLLAGLLSHQYVEAFRISDDGPAAHADWRTAESGTKYVPGWLVIGDASEAGNIPLIQATSDAKCVSRRALIGNAPELAAADPNSTAYSERGEDEAAAQRVRDVRALEAAREAEADLFITTRPYLHTFTWQFAREVVIATPEQALPLVSLYLRRQGIFLTYRSPDGTATHSFNRGLFYWVGTRDLLPSGWRWFSACVHADEERDALTDLGQSLFQRVQRALQNRDAALWALNQPQNNDTADDALGSLDNVLLGLMAAVDVAARIAHRTLGLDGSEYKAGWQYKRWLKKVEVAAPALAAVVGPDSQGINTLEVLRLLRNSIHGAALQPLAISTRPTQRDATLVGLPSADAQRLLNAMDALGGRSAFGLRILLPDRIHADPGKLLDAIFAGAVNLLDQLMRETPVERLAGTLQSSDTGPPQDDDIFGEEQRESIRLQLGLEGLNHPS
jgi:hypothetical protein